MGMQGSTRASGNEAFRVSDGGPFFAPRRAKIRAPFGMVRLGAPGKSHKGAEIVWLHLH